MKVLNYCFLFLSVFIISSCSDRFETEEIEFERYVSIEECPIVNSLEELNILLGYENAVGIEVLTEVYQPNTKANPPIQTKSGFTRKYTVRPEQKTQFGPDLAALIGVEPYLVYFVSLDRYDIDIYTGGKRFFLVESLNCGAKPVMGYGDVETSDFDNLGYRIQKSGNPTTLSTHLYYISGSFSGSAVRKSYPRNPEKLEWNFILL